MVEGKQVWPLIAWALIPGALLLVLALRGERIAWPVRPRLANYLLSGERKLCNARKRQELSPERVILRGFIENHPFG